VQREQTDSDRRAYHLKDKQRLAGHQLHGESEIARA